jgi:glycosyltransferase involved in cell wall biosynthesis
MDNRRPTLISVVMPSYDEAEGLPIVLRSVLEVLAATGFAHEVIVVDDGSADATREVMLRLCEAHATLRYIRLSRNFGKEAALSAGLKAATGDAVILMDSDGQHPAALIPEMLKHWREGFEVVAGVQEARPETLPKRLFKRAYYHLLEAGSHVVIPPDAGDFRLLDRKVADAINALPERNRLMKGLYAWVGFKTYFLPFRAESRVAGHTKFSWGQLFRLAFTGLTSFTVVPLRLVSISGLVISIGATLYGLYLIIEHYIDGGHMAGWATLSVGMMFLSGVQLLALGVIGEYLGRTFEEAKQRPVYIVAEDTRLKVNSHAQAPVYDATPIVAEARLPDNPALS